MRVLIVHPHIFAGGAEKVVVNLAHHLGKMGCHVDIATLTLDPSMVPDIPGGLSYLMPDCAAAHPDKSSLTAVARSMFIESKYLIDLIKGRVGDYDLFNPHNYPAYWAVGLTGGCEPVVWHCNEVLGPYDETRDLYDKSVVFRLALDVAKKFDEFVVRGIEQIVTCSEYNGRLIRERYGRSAEVVNTCVDYRFFRENVEDMKDALGLGETPLLLHVGSLIKRKNQLVSLQVAKLLKRRLGSIKLAIVGEGPWSYNLKRAVSDLHLEEDVLFFGKVSEEDLRSLYHACDVNLFPVQEQTWGLVPFEALAAGKPSVVSMRCGAAEVFQRRKLGPVVEPVVGETAKAVYYLLKNPEDVSTMIENGRRYIREHLSYEKYAERILDIFKSTIAQSA